MTEFERQVAEALRTIKFRIGGGVESFALAPMDDEHIERLAPRVAAAINAAGKFHYHNGAGEAEAAGLAALRGEV